MIYFATPSTMTIRAVAQAGWCGLIDQPNTGYRADILNGSSWIADCGVYGADGSDKFDPQAWDRFLTDRA